MTITTPTENPLISIRDTIAFDSRDWAEDECLAWIWGIVFGWGNESIQKLAEQFKWKSVTVERLKRLHREYVNAMSLVGQKGNEIA